MSIGTIYRQLGMATCCALVLAIGFRADFAAAGECQGSSEIDSCLVGAWKQSGGGAVEWMRQVMPQMQIPHAEQRGGIIVLKPDGTYFTTPMTANTTIVLEDDGRVLKADGELVTEATGNWSASEGKLNLCQAGGSVAGSAKLTMPGGQMTMPLPNPGTSGPMQMDYSCSGDSFETRLSMPGMPIPMKTTYSRVSGKP